MHACMHDGLVLGSMADAHLSGTSQHRRSVGRDKTGKPMSDIHSEQLQKPSTHGAVKSLVSEYHVSW